MWIVNNEVGRVVASKKNAANFFGFVKFFGGVSGVI
jgi:hypothetical protein